MIFTEIGLNIASAIGANYDQNKTYPYDSEKDDWKLESPNNGNNNGVNGSPKLNNLTTGEISRMTLGELKNSKPDGWSIFENNGRVHIKDETGNFRIRIDPPDSITNYVHMHIYDSNKNLLDINGHIVGKKDIAGHIPWLDK